MKLLRSWLSATFDRWRALVSVVPVVMAIFSVLLLWSGWNAPASAAPGDVSITALSCDTSPEYVRIKNFGSTSESLSGFRLQSDPSQDYDLSAIVSSIGPGQTIEFQSGSGSADNTAAGIYKLTGSPIYRNGDPTDYARLVRSDASSQQVNCGSSPATPTPIPTPTPTPTATPTPTPTPTDAAGLHGDVDCDGDLDIGDGQKIARSLINLSVSQTGSCPEIGSEVASIFGDVDCDGDLDIGDAQKIARSLINLSVTQEPACPPIGSSPTWRSTTLQIHHIDVEQGDAALIISPGGQVAMVDNGRWTNCSNTVSYVQGLGIPSIDYHFATHYDADHIGCLDDLVAASVSVRVACYDRGGSKDTQTFDDYVAACGAKRQTASKGQVITLDSGSPTPVTIAVIDLNGAGVSTSDENALGLVLKLTYGAFDHVFAGDLPGDSPDIESLVGPEVGDIDVCKVNHHGSKFSSNDNWLNATDPQVCVLSVGNNSFGHPTAEALGRLHTHGVKTYWTNTGSGASPDPAFDRVGSSVMIQAQPGAGNSYTVSGEGFTDTYFNQ